MQRPWLRLSGNPLSRRGTAAPAACNAIENRLQFCPDSRSVVRTAWMAHVDGALFR